MCKIDLPRPTRQCFSALRIFCANLFFFVFTMPPRRFGRAATKVSNIGVVHGYGVKATRSVRRGEVLWTERLQLRVDPPASVEGTSRDFVATDHDAIWL